MTTVQHPVPVLSVPAPARPSAPKPVQIAALAFTTAIAAALAETGLAVWQQIASGAGTAGLVAAVGVRLAIFALVGILTVRMLRGGWAARLVLALGLGVIGLGSLLIGPIGWLLAGHGLGEWHPDVFGRAFAVSRVMHVAAVITGIIAMFWPGTRDYFARARGRSSA